MPSRVCVQGKVPVPVVKLKQSVTECFPVKFNFVVFFPAAHHQ